MKTKKTILLFAVMFLMGLTTINAQQNQKIAYVDSKKWEKEITTLFQEAQELDREYQSESVLLSEDQKKKKKEAITAKRQEAESLRMKYFGPDGELFTKRSELIQPIQEKVYNAINQVALTKNYAFVFDKAAGTSILFCSDKNDISDEILDEIANVMQTVRREDRKKGN